LLLSVVCRYFDESWAAEGYLPMPPITVSIRKPGEIIRYFLLVTKVLCEVFSSEFLRFPVDATMYYSFNTEHHVSQFTELAVEFALVQVRHQVASLAVIHSRFRKPLGELVRLSDVTAREKKIFQGLYMSSVSILM
jgi:hypothetical protein